MPRGNQEVTKVFYKGSDEDFIVFVESVSDLEKWKKDSSIPLAQVVDSFKIMITHKHGAQGQMDGASRATLENEFGTSNEDECIKQILTKGDVQKSDHPARGGSRNDTMGSRVSHGPQ